MSTIMHDTCQYTFFIRSNFLLRPLFFPCSQPDFSEIWTPIVNFLELCKFNAKFIVYLRLFCLTNL